MPLRSTLLLVSPKICGVESLVGSLAWLAVGVGGGWACSAGDLPMAGRSLARHRRHLSSSSASVLLIRVYWLAGPKRRMVHSPLLFAQSSRPGAAWCLFHNIIYRASIILMVHMLIMVTVARDVLIAAASAKELLPRRLILRLIVQGVSIPILMIRIAFSATPLRDMALMSSAHRLPVALMLLRQGVPRAHGGLARVLPLRVRRLLVAVQVLQVSHCLLWMDDVGLCLLLVRVACHFGLAGANGLRRQVLMRRVRARHWALALARRKALLPHHRLRLGQLNGVDTHLYLSLLHIDHCGFDGKIIVEEFLVSVAVKY